ncbi:transglycosylase domain-containing protein [Telmatospirillum sp. J64-1]|uniref:transglycosylase domain-containing protein n=1 Tax=Telmatospirillum sp. J64-1 TaxID=2502183 RepID=UPI00210545BF|nr:PBP1A family penicillin-binding protein [Telmatospirillum sp. J64-1]
MTLGIWGAVGLAGVLLYYAYDLPEIESATTFTRRPSISFVSVQGETFAAFGDLYGEAVSLATLPRHLPQAVLATEDRRFYRHFGLDFIGLARAAHVNYQAGRIVQGGSTITQQLAKNLFLTPERTMKRKIQELLMALKLEYRFTKDQILTLYLNRVYLGAGTYGVEAAAQRYFGHSAREVDLYQAAMIAGLLKAPSRYNPRADRNASHQRTVQVLANMVAAGYITQAEAAHAAQVGPTGVRQFSPAGRYFADWLMEQIESFGLPPNRDLVVQTTLDIALQRRVDRELSTLLADAGSKAGASQGAVVVMSQDGAIRALSGGRHYGESQFNRATQSRRQPGSAFKPFVYLAALEAGLSPEDLIEDAPVRIGNWRPENLNGRYEGPISLRRAMSQSSNAVAVRLIDRVGTKRVIQTAQRLGITSPIANDASIALGTSEVSLLELTGAYVPFSNGGYAVWPHGISEIRDRSGQVLWRRSGGGPGQMISAGPLAALNSMLADVVDYGTGRNARIDRPAAGKTGTSQDYRDAWFVGYTADLVAGVWVGNDDGTPMKRVTGGGLPAQLWAKVMNHAHEGQPVRQLPGVMAYSPPPPPAPAAPVIHNPLPAAVETLESVWDSLVNTLFGRR